MAKSNKRVKKLKRKKNTKRISYKNKSRKLIRKKMRKSVNKKRRKVGGAQKIRLSRNERVQRVKTDNTDTVTFDKVADTDEAIEKIIREAKKVLESDNRVLLSIVWPNNSYPNGPNRLPHQGHTFAISIDIPNKTLILFDNDGNYKYLSSKDEARNYIKIINDIKEYFDLGNILFFRDEDWCKKTEKKIKNIPEYEEQVELENTADEGKGEGGCQAHVCALENLKLIQVFSIYTTEEKKKYLIDKKGKAYVTDGKEEQASAVEGKGD